MIAVDLFTLPDGKIVGFHMQGHAGFAQEGEDIVCAAVSSAAYLVVNTCVEVLGASPLSLRVEEGEMRFRIEQKDERACRSLFAGLKLHLTALEEQYGAYMKVQYLEI